MAVRTAEALNLLRQQPPGPDRDAYDWAVQNATAIDQNDIALAPSHDILIHLHRVAAARLRDR
ncbi:hypothetical protein ACFVXW_19350 [Streptomyces sp. NPDC058251]|uniref:hypothetical protein n=1 Tax=Streptomyces sp. NPDC058251 TaxID=3346404 RepID=UPI0036EDCCC1